MRIAMFTNTYLPHIGGVAHSVHDLARQCRRLGHQVLVVAPTFAGGQRNTAEVVRLPAIQNFNGSDFSLTLPVPANLRERLDLFAPDLIHSHHPYLLGDTALRLAAARRLPLVFTHHTMYENYTHYVPADSQRLRQFVIELSTGYANMCSQVIAPSRSVKQILQQRGVEAAVAVVPTGVDRNRFTRAQRQRWRQRLQIDANAAVVGHVGRLAPEKNLEFLLRAILAFLRASDSAQALIVGDGPLRSRLQNSVVKADLQRRVHFLGSLKAQDLVDAYYAMDVFAFASKSETQGMVLAEAMTAGLPVVALDAVGVRDIVVDQDNGCLLLEQDVAAFVAALQRVAGADQRQAMAAAARRRSEDFAAPLCAERVVELYAELIAVDQAVLTNPDTSWDKLRRAVEQEWQLWNNRISAAMHALGK